MIRPRPAAPPERRYGSWASALSAEDIPLHPSAMATNPALHRASPSHLVYQISRCRLSRASLSERSFDVESALRAPITARSFFFVFVSSLLPPCGHPGLASGWLSAEVLPPPPPITCPCVP